MTSIRKIKHRIEAYKSTVALLKQKIKKLSTQLGEGESVDNGESVEEGEIRGEPKEKRKRKFADESNVDGLLACIDEKGAGSIDEVLKEIFDRFNTLSHSEMRKVFGHMLPHLSNPLKYTVLHDVILFSRDLEKYAVVYKVFYPDAIEKDGSEVSDVLETVYYYAIDEEPADGLKSRCISILQKYANKPVIDGETINAEAFDAATSIRLYCKALDWDWTYNEYIRDVMHPELRKDHSPFAVFVLSVIYADWAKSLPAHKSLEYVIQMLDKITGIGTGEEIVHSMHSLETQLVCALILRQFRPGAAVKWHRKRIEEASEREKDLIDRAWSISFL
ncbi:uncharacterized protein NEMAJ01_0177 [Nematocida major]|uniref:uncharacterized protein n=1 Tax=Nematocida major TaxID=1912982 RepID=UPI00200835D0|nr:uncharacterized protein NEMAJ01_0177 [Nematocida major]KAH9385281.1 hypothetical protein NEMAJ01_0177 [Nematocida major]